VAAKPIERFVKRQIQEQGGYERLCARYASGETVVGMSKTFPRPDGPAIDRSTLSNLIHRWCRLAPENQARWDAAERDHADSRGERAIHVLEESAVDRDSIQKAKALSDANFRYAGLRGRERWGETKPSISVTVNAASLHADALRHRLAEASRPLARALGQLEVGAPQIASGIGERACETDTGATE